MHLTIICDICIICIKILLLFTSLCLLQHLLHQVHKLENSLFHPFHLQTSSKQFISLMPILPSPMRIRGLQSITVVVPSFTLSTQLSIACSYFSNRRIWRQQGNQGDEWHVGQATISTAKNWLLVITATVGIGYRGDIAIDDVLISVSSV